MAGISSSRSALAGLLLTLALGPAIVATQRRIDGQLGTFRAQDESLYLWSGRQVRRMVPGFENLAGDIYWLRTVQYFGGHRLFASGRRFELLEPLVEITTTLDPRLEIAYRYGAVFLSEFPPVGAGRPKSGVALLERGTKNLPGAWRLRQDLGFFTFLFLHDAHRAAAILVEARNIPGAPYWLETLAAQLLVKGGDRKAARRMWEQMRDQAEGGLLKAQAVDRLLVLDTLDQADRLTAGVAQFVRRTGRRPARLAELGLAGIQAGTITDAMGVPFDYDPASGTVSVSRRSALWRPD